MAVNEALYRTKCALPVELLNGIAPGPSSSALFRSSQLLHALGAWPAQANVHGDTKCCSSPHRGQRRCDNQSGISLAAANAEQSTGPSFPVTHDERSSQSAGCKPPKANVKFTLRMQYWRFDGITACDMVPQNPADQIGRSAHERLTGQL